MRPSITDHVYRTLSYTGTRHPLFGKCAFRGTCPAGKAEHVSAEEFRSLKATPPSRERS